MKSGTPQSTIGNSMVSLTSFQFSIVKSPVLPPDKISPITMLRVRRVFADKVEFRLRDSLCTLPSFNVMSNSSGGVSEDGNIFQWLSNTSRGQTRGGNHKPGNRGDAEKAAIGG